MDLEVKMNKKVADALCRIPKTFAHKRQAGPGRKGQVDITGCSHGYRIELEGKRLGNKPTPLQQFWLARWAAVGAITGVYYSVEEAIDIVMKGLADRQVSIGIYYQHKKLFENPGGAQDEGG
jgi:hypothetical protein